jgi:hypothetical protein
VFASASHTLKELDLGWNQIKVRGQGLELLYASLLHWFVACKLTCTSASAARPSNTVQGVLGWNQIKLPPGKFKCFKHKQQSLYAGGLANA